MCAQERSNDLLKVSDNDGISGLPSLEARSNSSSSQSAQLDGQVSSISVLRLTLSSQSCDEIQRDECHLEQDVEEDILNRNDKIPDGTKGDPSFLLQNDEKDFTLAPEHTKGVKGMLP